MKIMYGFLSKLLISGKLKFEQGKIILMGEPMVIVPLEFYIEATKQILENEDRKEMIELYLDAWEAGACFMNDVARVYKMKKYEERYKIAMDTISMAGFGDYKTIEFRRGEVTHFRIIDNILAKKFIPSKKPVCHVIRGFNAGGGTIVHERIMNCIEPECTAVNRDHCTHLNLNTILLKKYKNRALVKEQLDIPWLLKKQQTFIKVLNKNIKI